MAFLHILASVRHTARLFNDYTLWLIHQENPSNILAYPLLTLQVVPLTTSSFTTTSTNSRKHGIRDFLVKTVSKVVLLPQLLCFRTCLMKHSIQPSVTTCTSKSGSGMQWNPTGDNRVSSTHERRSRAKVASSTTALAHRFPPPSSSGC